MDLIPSGVATVACWILTGTFAWAVAAKIVRHEEWIQAVPSYGFRGAAARSIAVGVPVLEVAIVMAFVAASRHVAGALTLAAIAGFSAAILRAHALRGDRLPCGCFGRSRERDYRLLLARNASLALGAALVLLSASDVPLVHAPGSLPIVLVAVGSLVAIWTASQSAIALWRR